MRENIIGESIAVPNFEAVGSNLLATNVSSQGDPMMRFSCSQLVIERLDPLVNPGVVPSPHLHQVDFSELLDCRHVLPRPNRTYKRVNQFASIGLAANGGITVYYIPAPGAGVDVTTLKPGFRMLVGDAILRTPPQTAAKVCHRCIASTETDNSNVNCDAPESAAFPTGFCAGGIRSVLTFPTCWDGVNLDSPNHESHVSYPIEGNENDALGAYGTCPSTHPVKIPRVMFEVMWDTHGSQPFVWSTGDKEGYTQHADYVFGWQDAALQRAMDSRACNGSTCAGVLRAQSDEEAMNCTVARVVDEPIDGWLAALAGNDILS
ncbi:hypothetical protein F5Y16DRAFT_414676 [Xylariaceae sp. FL0255]|nr:hypothetical protein F5Y16DRAFT_414676 [Xylariaceae sp. FL0255]